MLHTDAALRLLQRGEVTSCACAHRRGESTAGEGGAGSPPCTRLDGIKPLLGCCATGCRLRRRNSFSSRPERDCRTIRYCYSRAVFCRSDSLTDDVLPNIIHLPDLKPTPPKTDTIPSDSMVRLTREDVDDIKRRRVDHLKMAAAWLRESLEADASNMLAHLHLGRVQSLRNQNDDALKLLSKSSTSDDPAVAYLSLLFTGALHERQGLLETAAHDYRMAIAAISNLSSGLYRLERGPATHWTCRRVPRPLTPGCGRHSADPTRTVAVIPR